MKRPNQLAWVVLTVCGGRVFFNFNPLLKLDGYYLLSLHLYLRNSFTNTATSAVFTVLILRCKDQFSEEWDIVAKDEFKPSFRRGPEVVWKHVRGDQTKNDQTLTADQVAAYALDRFRGETERAALAR